MVLLPSDKYTTFSRKHAYYRKQIHRVPKFTRVRPSVSPCVLLFPAGAALTSPFTCSLRFEPTRKASRFRSLVPDGEQPFRPINPPHIFRSTFLRLCINDSFFLRLSALAGSELVAQPDDAIQFAKLIHTPLIL